jgi:hypothetical protein
MNFKELAETLNPEPEGPASFAFLFFKLVFKELVGFRGFAWRRLVFWGWLSKRKSDVC